MSVIDVVQNPPDENRYLTLKCKLLERHSLSEQRKLDRFLSDSELFEKLTVEISEVKQSSGTFRSRTPFRNRNRSRGHRNWLCRYQYRFGSKARICEPPCSYVQQNQEN